MFLKIFQNFVKKQIKDISLGGSKVFYHKIKIFFKVVLSYTFIFLLGAIVPIIMIFKNFFRFHFYELQSERIGYYSSWEPFILMTHHKLIKKNKKTFPCLVYIQNIVANKYLTKLYLNKMKSLKHYYFLKGNYFWELLTKSYKFWTGKSIKTFFKTRIIMYPSFLKSPCLIKIPNSDEIKSMYLLEKLKIPKNSKWICIHNRDSGYLDNQTKKGYLKFHDWNYHDVRDFNVSDLLPASDYFTKRGYYVIRTCNFSNQKISSQNPKIIDYVNSEYRSDFGEIFFFSKCKFYFGSTAGCWKIAKYFRKPAFLINGFPFADLFLMPWKYPGIFKKLKLENNRIISIKEMVKENLNHVNNKNLLIKRGIQVVNNNPTEILDLAIEAVNIIENKDKKSENYKRKLDKVLDEVSKNSLINFKYYRNPIGEKFLEELKL